MGTIDACFNVINGTSAIGLGIGCHDLLPGKRDDTTTTLPITVTTHLVEAERNIG